MENRQKGCFITLEGGEGSGKTTLLNHLADFLKKQHFEVVVTHEPGGTALGAVIRNWLLKRSTTEPLCNRSELLLFLADRAQHIEEVISPALQSGKIVLCDRFNDSTIAYQGAARGLGISYVKQLCQLTCQSVLPQLTLFLDVPPEVGLSRSKWTLKQEAARGELDRIESESLIFHWKIQKALQDLAREEPSRIYTINAQQSKSDVFKEAISILRQHPTLLDLKTVL